MLDEEKINILRLINHHRQYCEGESCNISLMLILEILERAGLEFTQEEKRLFI